MPIPVSQLFVYLSQQSTLLQSTPIVSSLYRILAHAYTLHKIAFSVQKNLYSPHRRIPRTAAAKACHPSRPCITHVTTAGGMGEEGREKQRQSKQSPLKHHWHCSMHGRARPPYLVTVICLSHSKKQISAALLEQQVGHGSASD